MNVKIKSRKKERKGRGYSIPEIVEAKVEWKDFNRMGIRIDPRRKTVYPKNIADLKEIHKELKPVKDLHKKPKKVEKKAETKPAPEKKAPEVKE